MLDIMTIGERIREALTHAGMTQSRLAEIAGVTVQAVGQWLKTSRVDKRHFPTIAKATGVRMEWLLAGDGPMLSSEVREHTPPYESTPEYGSERSVPLIAWDMAKEWSVAIKQAGSARPRMIPCIKPISHHAFALQVPSRSMNSASGLSVPEGYIIVVDPERGRKASPGDLVVAQIEGQQGVTFKQLAQEDGRTYLRPLNPQHPSVFEPFQIIGKVVQVMLDL